jgi:hypothetical protein
MKDVGIPDGPNLPDAVRDSRDLGEALDMASGLLNEGLKRRGPS